MMQRSAAVGNPVLAFVNWEEVFSTNHRGRKEVRFYLKRRDGTSDLAVVGKQKKLGHHSKTSSCSSYRYRYAKRNKPLFLSLNLPVEIPPKLRSRQDVIDCLSSIVFDGSFLSPPQPVNGLLGSNNIKVRRHTTECVWVGSSWTCRKKKKHFQAYTCRGVKISVWDFVYVLAQESKRLVAYINDLYEDSQGNKLAVVQWFHKIDETALDIPRTTYHNNEILFSHCLQDLSIKCIDGLATVLSPQHHLDFLKSKAAPTILEQPLVCRYQFESGKVKVKVKLFDITQVKGYWNQTILRFLDADDVSIRPNKRLKKLVESEYSLGSEIEVLSQDSGVRGVWFKGVVVKKHKDKLKVRYQDLKDAVDESVNLEEWISSSTIAGADELGIRHAGRTTVRPTRSTNKITACSIDVGCIVDAWMHDGWWEGIIVEKESDDKIHVHFPGEKERSILRSKDLRYSQEWVENSWKKLKNRPDLVRLISCSTETNDDLSSLSSEGNKDLEMGLLAKLTWNWATKKRRLMGFYRNANLVDCKVTYDRVGSSLTRMVMSR